jgi:phosphoglucan,water dikinase
MTHGRSIRIGNQTAFSSGEVILPFKFALDHGFDAFEWFPDKKKTGEGWTVRDVPPDIRSWIRQTAAVHDIRLSVHAPSSWSPRDQEAVSPFLEAIDFARDIGAVLFNFHLETEWGSRGYLDAVRPLIRLLGDEGIGLAVENTVYTSPQNFADFFRCLHESGEIAAGRIGICLDVGHANLFSGTRNDYLRFVDMLPPEIPIVHVHMHENYGDQDSHLTIFTGPAGNDDRGIRGLVERLKKKDFAGCIILEQWPKPEMLLVEARTRLLAIIGEESESAQAEGNNKEGKDIVTKFAEATGRFLSWRKRLDWILHLLTDGAEKPDLDLLAYVAVYLRFLGTGEIRCGEDGGHYRPSHHAKIAGHIYKKLLALATDDTRFVIRKIAPWLPSFDREFMRSEPLTLIRDIAHRNDIPRELKQEIKTTLQNKLHRSAGPEDLEVSRALWERITASGASYPEDFVSEFRRFHEELKDFFHAGTLKELLSRMIEKGEFDDIPALREFVTALDHPGDPMERLSLLTRIRSRIGEKILLDSSAASLRLQTVDVRLEDNSFALLSTIINDIEGRLKRHGQLPWQKALRASLLATANIRLGGFDAEECFAIEAEITAILSVLDTSRRDHLLRLRASADRSVRLAESYSDRVLSLFSEKATTLGRALGVKEHAIKVYAEAEIRNHPVFQLSKLASLFTKRIRELLSLPLWDIVVPGTAKGRLLVGPTLSEVHTFRGEQTIVLAHRIVGDEEIPPYVTGIIATAETPLLSHLAVRARQSGTVFVFCGEEKRIEELRSFSERWISLTADGKDFAVSPTGYSKGRRQGGQCVKATVALRSDFDYPHDTLITGDLSSPAVGGKANSAGRLAEISKRGGSGFTAPEGLAIPFGVMETSLHSDPVIAAEYASLARESDRNLGGGQDDYLARMKDIIMQLSLPEAITSDIARLFGRECRLMVRSSSNCEDREGFSGAGIYDTVANVSFPEIVSAVRRVWASLWNRRAVDARRNAGIPHDACRMAVLIQPLMQADISFVMHTVNPVTGSEDEILIELAVGLGETLASCLEAGSPYRLIYRKKDDATEMLSFADYSFASRPGRSGGTVRERVDYSKIPFSRDDNFREKMARTIGKAGLFTERAWGKPLDIEGLVSGGESCLLQARPQHLLHRGGKKR